MKLITFLLTICSATFFSCYADAWIQKADVGGGGRWGAVGFSINGKGYVGTGSMFGEEYSQTFWEYNPVTDSWTQKADLEGIGRNQATGFSIGTKGYIGTGQIDGYNQVTNDFWEYDSQTNTWVQKASFPGGKRQVAIGFAIGSKGYLGTGSNGDGSVFKKDFWEYDPLSDVWTIKADYGGGAIAGLSGFVIAGRAYLGTGRDNSLTYRNDFWEYDPITDAWTKKSNFAGNIRAGAVGFAMNGFGYLGVGYAIDTMQKWFNDFWEYDTYNDSWIKVSDYAGNGAVLMIGFSINDKGYIGTGIDEDYFIYSDFWEYDADSSVGTASETLSQLKYSFQVNPTLISHSSTVIFTTEGITHTTIWLFDSKGRRIRALLDQNVEAGEYQLEFKRDQLSSGIYFLKVRMNEAISITKIIIQ